MADGWLLAWVLAVIFLATLIRSAFGFGEALVAVPLLALLIPVEIAAWPVSWAAMWRARRKHSRKAASLLPG